MNTDGHRYCQGRRQEGLTAEQAKCAEDKHLGWTQVNAAFTFRILASRGIPLTASRAAWAERVVDNSFKLTENVSDMSKVITPHFEELIDRFVASGRFNNKSEVIRAGLRLLEEHEATNTAASRDDLTRIIETALRDPHPLIPATDLLQRRPRR